MTREEAKRIAVGLRTDFKCESDTMVDFCNTVIKALEQEPKILNTLDFAIDASNGDTNYFVGFRNGLRYAKSLIDGEEPQFESCTEQKSKTGHWIRLNDYTDEKDEHKCSNCGFESMGATRFCPDCGAKMIEPQETETWNGYHGQITAPKGTFEKIYEDAESEDKE